MSPLAQMYSTNLSTLTPRETTLIEPCITSTRVQQERNAQREAGTFIRKSPTSAVGYLASGALYKTQGNIQAALDTYRQGIQLVPTSDIQHYQLIKEERALSAMLFQQRCGFYQRLPYNIICRIFGLLNYKELLQCTSVCQEWCDFLLDWPEFWRILSYRDPQILRATWVSLIRREAEELDLRGPMSDVSIHRFLTFVLHSKNCNIRRLSLCDLYLSELNAAVLGQVLESMRPSLKQVQFIDCVLYPNSVVGPILTSCSTATHVSFSRSTRIPGDRNYVAQKSEIQIAGPTMHMYSLTYLMLAFEYPPPPRNRSPFQVDTSQLCSIICQCTNLVHLFMDSGGSVHHGLCIMEALKHCTHIKNIIINDKAEMPRTVMSAIADNEYDDDPSVTGALFTRSKLFTRPHPRTRGLRRLVLSGGIIKLGYQDLSSVLKRTHKSLKLLYLYFNGTTINANALDKLASYGAPRLQEIRLSTEDYASSENRQKTITKTLAALFASSPALEAIDVNDTFNTHASSPSHDTHNPTGILQVDDRVLKAIAQSCRRIRHLRIAGERRFTNEGMLYFATKGGSKLTYLEADMERSNVVPVVRKLSSLQRIHLRKDAYRIGDDISSEYYEEAIARQILQERGGQLSVL